MDAKPLALGKILSERQRFVVPVYQRTYQWTRRELEPLFDQLEGKADELLSTGKVAFSHYMGALLLIPEGDPVFGQVQVFNVVDGQQRLTTFHLCFAALKDVARARGFEGLSKQIADLLVHGTDVPMQDARTERYKLTPTRFDRDLFQDLVDKTRPELTRLYAGEFYKNGNVLKTAPEALRAYSYFWDEAAEYITRGLWDEAGSLDLAAAELRLRALSTALFEQFRLIVITLSKDDDAQVIFETLNSGGKPLAAMDLVRNDIFLRAGRRNEDQAELLDNHWSIFEEAFWKQEQVQGRMRKPRIDFFLAHALAAETGAIVALGELFAEYKAFVAERAFTDAATELACLTEYVPIYRTLAAPDGATALSRLARRLNTFDVSTAYPLVFVIAASPAEEDVKERLYRLVSSYVIRRALCYLTPKAYNKTFVELAAQLKAKGVSDAAFAEYFATRLGDTIRFPDDAELRAAIRQRPQYGWIPQNRLRMILEELEFASRGKFNVMGSLQEGLSIEHVMPQGWSSAWTLPSGRAAPLDLVTGADETMRAEIETRKALIHTLPNLTLLTPPANASAGNANFTLKADRLKDSLLNLNMEILAAGSWDETTIAARADRLANLAVGLYPAPAMCLQAQGPAQNTSLVGA